MSKKIDGFRIRVANPNFIISNFFLESSTYEVFERDPVKYSQYQVAIQAAITDLVPEEEKETKVKKLI